MKTAVWICTCTGLILARLAAADSIAFENGRSIDDAEILAIQDGVLYFSYGDGKRARVPVTRVKALTRQAAEASTGGGARLVQFKDHTEDDDEGKLVVIGLDESRKRFREPLFRAYGLQEDDKGERRLYLYQNHRVKDPTTTYSLPEIRSGAYRKKAFFLKVAGRAVAWRLELWIDGELALTHEAAEVAVEPGWWRSREVDRQVRLRDDDVSGEVTAETGELPPVTCQITQCQLIKGIDRKAPAFELAYMLNSEETRIPLPEVTLYYLLETADGERTVKDQKCEPSSGEELAISRRLTRTFSFELSRKTILGARPLTQYDDEELERVIYWRLEVTYDGRAIAVRESPYPEVAKTLPANWWEGKRRR